MQKHPGVHFTNELKTYDRMLKCSLFIISKKFKLMPGNIRIQELKLLHIKGCVIIWFVEIHFMRLIRFTT